MDAGAHPRIVEESLRHVAGNRVIRPRYCCQRCEAADVLGFATSGSRQSAQPATDSWYEVAQGVGEPGMDSPQRELAPAVRFELTTKRLTAARSTTELRRNAARSRTGSSGRTDHSATVRTGSKLTPAHSIITTEYIPIYFGGSSDQETPYSR